LKNAMRAALAARLLLPLALFTAPLAARAQLPEKELDTPYVPTPQVVVERMLDMAGIKPGDLLVDLGSGDGRLVITAAQKYGAHGFGVELDPRLVYRANQAAERAGVADRVKFLRKDLFQTDFHDADVLTLYLLPDVNMALRPRILAELKPGARVVSHDYDMRDWQPDAQAKVPAPDKMVGLRKESMVYLWIVPAKVEGIWELTFDGKSQNVRLSIWQRFQEVSGSVRVPGQSAWPILSARLRGAELRLKVTGGVYDDEDPVELVGTVSGDTFSGRVWLDEERVTAAFRARRRAEP